MSKGSQWVALDKYLVQEFKYIKRTYSMIEAMFSYSCDVNCDKTGSIAGYAKQWGWSRNKVRRFIKGINSVKGHLKDSKRTVKGQPIHFIDKALMNKKDTKKTVKGHLKDTTVKNNSIYTSTFLTFWEAYPRKVGKKPAFQAYQKISNPRPSLEEVLEAIKQQSKTPQWQNKQYIPHPAKWLNQRLWEDEVYGNTKPPKIVSTITVNPNDRC